MMQMTLLDPAPGVRRRDPETSRSAAEAAKQLQTDHHQIILECLRKHGPLGKDGLAARTRLDDVQVCRRLTELHRMGHIEPTGNTVSSTAGRAEREWRITGGGPA